MTVLVLPNLGCHVDYVVDTDSDPELSLSNFLRSHSGRHGRNNKTMKMDARLGCATTSPNDSEGIKQSKK
jgi:hypothetical protein